MLPRGTTSADILRCFESLRRDLAMQGRREAGAFAGYDSLHLDLGGGRAVGAMVASAFVTAESPTTQRVRFCAHYALPKHLATGQRGMVADGSGSTVALPPPR